MPEPAPGRGPDPAPEPGVPPAGLSPAADRAERTASLPRQTLRKLVFPLVLLLAAAGIAYLLYGTPLGQQIREDRELVRQWVQARPALAPLLLVTAYTIIGVFALPVWWVQVIAGYCFGLMMGVFWCQAGAILATLISVLISDWLLGEWFHQRVEPYAARLRSFDERLGHNGLLVVTLVRLSHLMPFGISNYLFGLTQISLLDAMLGTVLGGTFAKMINVTWGVDPRLFGTWHYWFTFAWVNLLLLSPLLLRYLRPQWFRRIGIE